MRPTYLLPLTLACLCNAAQANVMTFDNLPSGGTGSYTEDGITLLGEDFVSLPTGTLHLDVGGVPTNNSSYRFEFATGPFELNSFDLVAFPNEVSENAVGSLTGLGINGEIVRSTFFDITTSQTFSFSDWSNLNLLIVSATGEIDDHFSIDNLTLGPSVIIPEPETWAMMIAGFGLVGAVLRRRTRRMRTGIPAFNNRDDRREVIRFQAEASRHILIAGLTGVRWGVRNKRLPPRQGNPVRANH